MMDAYERLKKLKDEISSSAVASGRRPEDISILAVSKGQSAAAMLEFSRLGVKSFGESRVQEALLKMKELDGEELDFHYIGRLQKNKFKSMAGRFKLVHSMDSIEKADLLNKACGVAGVAQSVLVQVNLAGEQQKGGVSPEELAGLVKYIRGLDALKLKGLMLIPPLSGDPEENRPYFRKMKILFEKYRDDNFDILSMGMSDDFHIAVSEGSTMVRTGTLLFGGRG